MGILLALLIYRRIKDETSNIFGFLVLLDFNVGGKIMDRTTEIHEWMKNLDDDKKMRFAINWRIPHSLFNVACNLYPGGYMKLQNIDWFKIFQSKDLGVWSHGGPVNVQAL